MRSFSEINIIIENILSYYVEVYIYIYIILNKWGEKEASLYLADTQILAFITRNKRIPQLFISDWVILL